MKRIGLFLLLVSAPHLAACMAGSEDSSSLAKQSAGAESIAQCAVIDEDYCRVGSENVYLKVDAKGAPQNFVVESLDFNAPLQGSLQTDGDTTTFIHYPNGTTTVVTGGIRVAGTTFRGWASVGAQAVLDLECNCPLAAAADEETQQVPSK